MMLEQIGSITPQIVEFALDGLTMRHQAIASNIANINSVGYKPITISFESQISDLRNKFDDGSVQGSDFHFDPIVSYGKTQEQAGGSAGIDMNTVQLNQNVIRYHALIKGMDHYISMLSIAVKEGRN